MLSKADRVVSNTPVRHSDPLPAHQKIDLVEDDVDRIEIVAQNFVEPIELLVRRDTTLRNADIDTGFVSRILRQAIDSAVVRFDRLAVDFDNTEPISLGVREFENLLTDRVDDERFPGPRRPVEEHVGRTVPLQCRSKIGDDIVN